MSVLGRATSLLAAAALVAASAPEAPACGDKFLVPARGRRFGPRPADRAGVAVLLYAPPGTVLDAALRAMDVEAQLRHAGYRGVVRAGAAGAAVDERAWDVVVLDPGDGSAAGRLAAASAPAVVRVVFGAGLPADQEGGSKSHRVLRSPRRPQAFLDAVDDAVARLPRDRRRARALAAPAGGVSD